MQVMSRFRKWMGDAVLRRGVRLTILALIENNSRYFAAVKRIPFPQTILLICKVTANKCFITTPPNKWVVHFQYSCWESMKILRITVPWMTVCCLYGVCKNLYQKKAYWFLLFRMQEQMLLQNYI